MKIMILAAATFLGSVSSAAAHKTIKHVYHPGRACVPSSGKQGSYNGRILNGVVIEDQNSPEICQPQVIYPRSPSSNGRILNGVVRETR